jgi:serine/threonine protein kinase
VSAADSLEIRLNDRNRHDENDPLSETSRDACAGEPQPVINAENECTVSVSDAVHPTPVAPLETVESIGNYRILGVLGEGGMGVVYEAEQSSPHRRVALKVMRRGHTVDEVHSRMFHHEAQTLARLRHPKIAAVYESGHTVDGHDFFAMELVRGRTLGEWLEDRSASLTSW